MYRGSNLSRLKKTDRKTNTWKINIEKFAAVSAVSAYTDIFNFVLYNHKTRLKYKLGVWLRTEQKPHSLSGYERGIFLYSC